MAQEQRDGQVQSVWERRWRERIAAWRESGLSQQAFCQAHGVSVSSFSHWKSKLAKRDEMQVQSPVAAGARTAEGGSAAEKSSEALRWTEFRWPTVGAEMAVGGPMSMGFEIVLPRGLSVRLGPGFEAESLRRLLAVLEERSC